MTDGEWRATASQHADAVSQDAGGAADASPNEVAEPTARTKAQAAWSARAALHGRIGALATAQTVAALLHHAPVRPGDVVLDLGCGVGHAAAAAAAIGADATGVDFAPGMVAAARERHPGTRFRIGDVVALSASAAAADAALANFTLLHLEDRDAALREINRALRPGGVFAWTTWAAREDNPMFAATAALPSVRTNLFDLSERAAATRMLEAAGFAAPRVERVEIAIERPASETADLFRALDPAVDEAFAAAEDETARLRMAESVARAVSPLVEEGVLRATLTALLFVSLKPAPTAAEATSPTDAAQRGGFGVVRRLLGRKE